MLGTDKKLYIQDRLDKVQGGVYRVKTNGLDYICDKTTDQCYRQDSVQAKRLLKTNQIRIPCNILDNRILSQDWVCNPFTGDYVQISSHQYDDIHDRKFYDKNRWKLEHEKNGKSYIRDLKSGSRYDLESKTGWALATKFATLWDLPTVDSIKTYKKGDEFKLLNTEPHLVLQHIAYNLKNAKKSGTNNGNTGKILKKLNLNLSEMEKWMTYLGDVGSTRNRLSEIKQNQENLFKEYKSRLLELSTRYFQGDNRFIVSKKDPTDVRISAQQKSDENVRQKVAEYTAEKNNLINDIAEQLGRLHKEVEDLKESLEDERANYFTNNVIGEDYNRLNSDMKSIADTYSDDLKRHFTDLSKSIFNTDTGGYTSVYPF